MTDPVTPEEYGLRAAKRQLKKDNASLVEQNLALRSKVSVLAAQLEAERKGYQREINAILDRAESAETQLEAAQKVTDPVTPEEARLDKIRREHRHAMATRRDPGDSWLNGYQDDVEYLLRQRDSLAAQLEAAQDVIEAARGLYEQVETDESVGVCLADRVADAKEACPVCGHLWRQHDPEDGRCDAGMPLALDLDEWAKDGRTDLPCPCGRHPSYQRMRAAKLSRAALDSTQTHGGSDD